MTRSAAVSIFLLRVAVLIHIGDHADLGRRFRADTDEVRVDADGAGAERRTDRESRDSAIPCRSGCTSSAAGSAGAPSVSLLNVPWPRFYGRKHLGSVNGWLTGGDGGDERARSPTLGLSNALTGFFPAGGALRPRPMPLRLARGGFRRQTLRRSSTSFGAAMIGRRGVLRHARGGCKAYSGPSRRRCSRHRGPSGRRRG